MVDPPYNSRQKAEGGLTFLHHSVLATIWTVFWVLWVLPAVFGKRTVRRQATGSRILQLVLLLVAYVLIVNGALGWDWLNLRLAPEGKPSTAVGYGRCSPAWRSPVGHGFFSGPTGVRMRLSKRTIPWSDPDPTALSATLSTPGFWWRCWERPLLWASCAASSASC